MWIFLPHRKLGKSTIYIGKKWSPHHKLIFHITHFDICVSRYIFVPNFFFLFLSKVNTKWNIKTLLSLSALSPLSTHTLSLSLLLYISVSVYVPISHFTSLFLSLVLITLSLSLYLSSIDQKKISLDISFCFRVMSEHVSSDQSIQKEISISSFFTLKKINLCLLLTDIF